MAQFAVFKEEISPFAKFGLTHPFWNINWETIFSTWIVLIALVSLAFLCQYFLKKDQSVGQFIFVRAVGEFRNLVTQTLGIFHFRHFTFIASLFTFILISNLIALIPGLEEPTSDVMTTLALGIISFLYTQVSSIEANGIVEYVKGYFEPFFLMMPLNVISHLATVISISFRLFGNIFGGSVIAGLWASAIAGNIITESVGILSGINLTITGFFVLFEGFIQAFVFAMLSLTYLSIEVKEEKESTKKVC